MKKLEILFLLLLVCPVVKAYEYAFNWDQWKDATFSACTPYDVPSDGVNIFVQCTGDQVPNIHTFATASERESAPGTAMTKKFVSVVGDDNTLDRYYWAHFDTEQFRFFIDRTGTSDRSADVIVDGAGSYFFDYSASAGAALTPVNTYYAGGSGNTILHVKPDFSGGDSFTPSVYSWQRYYSPPFNESWAHTQMTPEGDGWYKGMGNQNSGEGLGALIWKYGDESTKTADITGLVSGDYYFYYYPYGDNAKYEPVARMGNRTANYKVWDYTESSEVSFTTTNEHGSATITVVCANANDLSKVKVVNHELCVPSGASLKVTVNDGTNVRELWLGKSNQGVTTYYFPGHQSALHKPGEEYCISDMKNVDLPTEHVYKINTGTNTYQSPVAETWGGDYYLSDHTKVFSEGIAFEDLLYADGNVRLMYHKIADPLVGVAVRTMQGATYLIARSADQLTTHRQTLKPGQECYTDENGEIYAWSNPNTPQYGWIALKIDNPDQYVGKKFDGVRGSYCAYASTSTDTWIPWDNPNMDVTSTPRILGDEATTLNTYPLACLVQPKTDDYFLLKPNLYEVCNIVDAMRSHGDHFIYVPDENAIMPETTMIGPDGQVTTVAKQNFYVEHGLNYGQDYAYASWLQIDTENGKDPYYENDIELLGGEQNLGMNWQLYDKVYDFPECVIVAAEHAHKEPYVYPLEAPLTDNMYQPANRNYMVLHILGKGEIQKYENDIIVGSSDYWSRYKYSEDRNAYRNDVVFALGKPNTTGKTMGDMTLYRYSVRHTQGDKAVEVPVVKITHSNVNGTDKFTVTSLSASKEAMNDPALGKDVTKSDPYFYDNKEFVLSDKLPTIKISDMFYSPLMTSYEANELVDGYYQYRLVLDEDNNNDMTSVAGYAPVYKTDVHVAGRTAYDQTTVDDDKDDKLVEDEYLTLNFTPDLRQNVTTYYELINANYEKVKVLSRAEFTDVAEDGFLTKPLQVSKNQSMTIGNYVPEAYTAYNDNTYGSYKRLIGDAAVTAQAGTLYESQLTLPGNKKGYHVDVEIGTKLSENYIYNERYLLRVWRQVGDEDKVLLNGSENFPEEYLVKSDANPNPFEITDDLGEKLDMTTHYDTMDDWARGADVIKGNDRTYYLSDTFWHTAIPEGETVKYYVTLYVKDDLVAQQAAPSTLAKRAQAVTQELQPYYVRKVETGTDGERGIITGVQGVTTDMAVRSVRYVNTIGQTSATPWSGANLVVTTLSDGTVKTRKIIY